jgi:hypothetical protein
MAYSYALVLTVRSLGKTFKQCQEQSNEELRWVCCIYATHIMLVAQGRERFTNAP